MAHATKLTKPGIERMKADPDVKRIDKPDKLAPGLFGRISPKGAKSWMCHFRVHGRQGKVALGRWPATGVAEARDRAREVREQAGAGVDPKAGPGATSTNALRAVAEDYIKALERGQLTGGRKAAVTPATVKERRSLLARRVYPALGDRPIDEITQPEVAPLLVQIDRDGGPVDRVLQTLMLAFKFAVSPGCSRANRPRPASPRGRPPRSCPARSATPSCGRCGGRRTHGAGPTATPSKCSC